MWLVREVFVTCLVIVLASSADPPKKQMFFDWNEIEQDFENIVDNPRKAFIDPVDNINYRLPNNTYPIHYHISLKTGVQAEDFEFSGNVEIEIEVKTVSSLITLHYRQININKVDLLSQDNVMIEENIQFSLEEYPKDFLHIPTTMPLNPDLIYKIRIDYNGTLRTDNNGFYRSSYVNAQGNTVWLATSKFESTNARHGFPCYDEPGIRAEYTVEMEHHESYITLSNMPQESRNPVAGRENYVVTKFVRSPPFQTYLVAFIVSDFEALENLAVKPPQRVFTTPGKTSQVAFALEHGVNVITKFEDHLGVDYLLPKLDQISIPDFASGAMENFGLVTYREVYLLYDETIHTANGKLNVAEVISHEYAHQWFGNLVSPAWWNFIWLNEGFATLFESYATGLVYPEWREMETFVTGTMHGVMQSDSQLNVRAMSHYIENPASIAALFDNVIYSKSGSVLRMLQHVLTEATFAKGLQLYLIDRFQKSATPNDLYRNLQIALNEDRPGNGINIAEFMNSWEYQGGYPVIHVSRSESTLVVSQSKFLQNYVEDPADTPSIWKIPINYIVGSNPSLSYTTPDFWLDTENITIYNSTSDPSKQWVENDWFLFNIQETGYYRVNYDLQIWNRIITELTTVTLGLSNIPIVNRAQLIDDSFNLARSNRLFYGVPLSIASYLHRETDYIPWAAFNRALSFLHTYLVGSPYYEHFRKLMRDNADAFYTKLGVTSKTGEPFLDKFGRNLAITWACMMGHAKCLADASALMDQVSNTLQIEPDLETVVYCNGLRGADESLFMKMWELALGERSADKTLIMNSLGCSYNSDLIVWYLNSTLDMTNSYSATDRARVFSAIYTGGGYAGYELTLDFVYNYYQEISEKISVGTLNNIFSNLGSRVSNEAQFSKLYELSERLQSAGHLTEASAGTTLTNAQSRMSFVEANLPTIEGWLEVNVQDVPPATELPLITFPTVSTDPSISSTGSSELPSVTDASTNIIETTTGGGIKIFASIFQLGSAIIIAALFKSVM